jgi:hypothetical protein
MIKYRKENTIAVLLKDKKFLKGLKSFCKNQNLLIFPIVNYTDIIAVPCFITIIEKSLLDDKYLNMLEEMALTIETNEWQLILIGNEKVNLTRTLMKKRIEMNSIISLEEMKKNIIKRMNSLIKEEKRRAKINNRVYRIVKLYIDVTTNGNLLDIEQYVALNLISKRTLRRDIRLLKDLYPDFNVYFKGSWTS